MSSEEVSAPLLGKEKAKAKAKEKEKEEEKEKEKMARVGGAVYAILCLSLAVNFLFLLEKKEPQSWPAEAVRDAELTAMERCSGHGDVFVDTVEVDENGKSVCECHECFTGPDCSIATPNCLANADVGDPLLFEEYWKSNADLGAVVIPAWYRMSYFTNDAQSQFFTDALISSIKELHALAGNAVTEGRYIVVGTGALQLINAIIHGLALQDTNDVSPVVATAPYYNLYPMQTSFLDSQHYGWAGEPANVRKTWTRAGVQIQLLASPNNPTGEIQEVAADFKGHVVHDHAYYWPHLTPITTTADRDIMVFTFSKITGHAGSRMGWAILKDFDLYQKVMKHVFLSTGGVSHDTQLRATQIMRAIIKKYAEDTQINSRQGIFHFGHEVLSSRWTTMQAIFRNSSRFTLQELKPEYCNFFGKLLAPSPAYAWIHCNDEADVDCNKVMRAAGILARPGEQFGSSNRFVRMSLLKRQSSFDNLAVHLHNLVTQNLAS